MNRKCKWYLILLVFLITCTGRGLSQGIKRQAIGSYGSGGITESLYIGQTIGQSFFTFGYRGSELILTPGFQQPLSYGAGNPESHLDRAGPDLYPNPASDYFIIETPGFLENALVRITDLHGRIISEKKIPRLDRFKMDCSGLQDGIYLVRVSSGKGLQNHVSKLIITK